MRTFRGSLVVILCVACGGAEHILGPTTYDVAGVWRFEQTITNTTLQVTCSTYGDLTVTQDGPRFTAQGTQSGYCEAPGGAQNFTDEPFVITNGTLDGTTVAFHDDECSYTGTAHGAKPDSAAGTATCRIAVEGTTVTLRGPWHVIPPPDDVPPTVTGSTFGGGTNGTLEAGDDTIYVRIVATDNTALRTIGYEIRDPSRFQTIRRDSLVIAADTVAALDDTLIFPLPLFLILPVPDGTPFQGSVFARDTSGNVAAANLAPMLVRPASPPSATGSVTGSTRPDSTGVLRDTLTITVSAAAPRALRYIGYRLTSFVGQGDSVAVTDTSGSHSFHLPIPFAWKDIMLRVEVFARDRLGLFDQKEVAQLRVVVFPSRPTQSFRVGQGVADVVLDPARGRVYLMTALDSTIQAGQPEVRVFQFSPPGFLPGIFTRWMASGMDLSPGGDSLVMTSFNGRLGILNLVTLAQDSTDLIAWTPPNRFPFKVGSTANGKAMISIASGTDPGQLVAFDLGSVTQTLRTDVGAAGAIGRAALLARTPDKTRMLVWSSSATASEGQLYFAATDSFGVSVPIPAPPVGTRSVSSDAAASRWLVGNQLLDGALTWLRQLGASIYSGTSVLSQDGVYAYVAVPEGVAKFRTSDGVRVELILLQSPPYELKITPDGNTLIAVGFGLQIIDLR
jgi:hypothetical protein